MRKNIQIFILSLIAVFVLSIFFYDSAHAQGSFTISGYVFTDLNANLNRDNGEPIWSGRTVELYTGPEIPPPNEPGVIVYVRSTVTNSNGFYSFDGLTGGENWRVRHVVPSGYRRTTDDSLPYFSLASDQTHNFGFILVPTPTPSLSLLPSPPPLPGPTAVDVNIIWGIFNPLRGDPQNVFDVIFMIADWLLNIAGTLIVILIIYSGIRFMLSRGSPGEIGKAKGILFWALVGFAAVLIGKGFIYLVESILEGNFPTVP